MDAALVKPLLSWIVRAVLYRIFEMPLPILEAVTGVLVALSTTGYDGLRGAGSEHLAVF